VKTWESLRIALRALSANKLRSSLTMLGMIIGVAAVITLVSVGRGAQNQVTQQIASLGTNLLFVTPGSTQEGGVRTAQGSAQTLTLEDAQAIAAPGAVPGVVAVAPELRFFGQIVAGGQNVNSALVGVTADYAQVRNYQVADGDFISTQQVDSHSSVAVLGASVAQQLFADTSPVGQEIKVNRVTLRVIGVLQAKGSQASGNQDDLVLVPITTMQNRLMAQRTARGGRTVSTINVQVDNQKDIDAAIQGIGDLLRERHRVSQDDFTIRSQEDMQQAFQQVTGIFTLLLGSIAGISLVVGGIGIMNIMLVSVTERTREIGIRKAVGARRRDILMQFLIESLVVALVGGGIGILTGMGLSRVVSGIQFSNQTIRTAVSLDAILLAFLVSGAIGVFFGIYPATRAARLNPIDALRYE